jgi:hypothetical protein
MGGLDAGVGLAWSGSASVDWRHLCIVVGEQDVGFLAFKRFPSLCVVVGRRTCVGLDG